MRPFRLSRRRLAHYGIASLAGATTATVHGATEASADSAAWRSLQDVALLADGRPNALDFSAQFKTGPAGAFGWAVPVGDGQIGFQQRGAPMRFLIASMVFSEPNGKIPDSSGIDRLVAALRQTGYNAVRLHFIDALLMDGRSKDFDFDPQQFDRLHLLLARLKAAGIYWIVDGMTSDNGGHGDVRPHRYVRKHRAKLDALVSEEGFAHWAMLVERVWGQTNPYTGVAPIRDPAMLGMILVNEGGIGFMATVDGNRYPASLLPRYRAWLEKYEAPAGAQPPDGTPSRGQEPPELPDAVRGTGPAHQRLARFVRAVETEAYARMTRQVRALGFGGLTTAFDNWGFLAADLTRQVLPWIDMHGYHDTPSAHGQPGSRIRQTSLFETQARGVRELSNARQWGKPFTVTEYGQPFWNASRYEMPALVAAMAAHHGWSAICQFAEAPIQFDYARSPHPRRDAMYPYGVGADPIARATERLAALLFLRGDVAPSDKRVRLHLQAEALFERSAGWEQVPEALSRLAFIVPVGLDFGPVPARPVPGELSIDLSEGASVWVKKLHNAMVRAGLDWGRDAVAPLRAAGVVAPGNRSQPEQGLYESDTGQITIDTAARRLRIQTPRCAVLTLPGGDAAQPGFSVRQASGPALFAVAALDDEHLSHSRRMLVWVLTDALNTGMQFQDQARTVLERIGSFPPRVRTIQARLEIGHADGRALKAWPLSLAGERRRAIPVVVTAQGIALAIDTATLPDGPALYFEIAAE